MNEKLVRPVFRFFNSRTKNAEIYINNGSVWLIFTNEKRWVFELTKEGTLWYNYYFFDNIFKYFSLGVVEHQDYITKWVENFIQNGIKHTDACQIGTSTSIEDAIQNGVKSTITRTAGRPRSVEDTIQNGVKNTNPLPNALPLRVEDTIQNGVKETKHNPFEDGLAMEEAIQNGVKRTTPASSPCWKLVEDVLQNGVKETTPGGYLGSVEMRGKTVHQFESPKQNNEVEDVIENGIEETKYCELHSLMRADHIIKDGIKETHWKRVDNHSTFVDRIINSEIQN